MPQRIIHCPPGHLLFIMLLAGSKMLSHSNKSAAVYNKFSYVKHDYDTCLPLDNLSHQFRAQCEIWMKNRHVNVCLLYDKDFTVFSSTVCERDTCCHCVLCSLTHTSVTPLALSMQAAEISKTVRIGNPTFLTLSIH